MSYNAEESMLITVKDRQKGWTHFTLPLAGRIVYLADTGKNTGQLTLYLEEEPFELKELEDIEYILVNVTNDPFASYAGSVVNLGYFCTRFSLAGGFITSTKPLTYATNNILDGAMFKQTIPLRHPEFILGQRESMNFIEDKECGENATHIIDFRFQKNMTDDYLVLYSWFDRDTDKGKSITRQSRMNSNYNKVITANVKEHKSYKTVLKYHGFQEKTVSKKKKIM